MTRDIQRCPHCGGPTRLTVVQHEPAETMGISFGRQEAFVVCRKCGARGPKAEFTFDSERTAKMREALDLWNRRSAPDGPPSKWDDGELEPGEEPATEKQVSFAGKIAARFGLRLPARKSKSMYRSFISEHKAKWDESFKRGGASRRGDDPGPVDDADYWSGYDMCGLDPYTGGFADNY